MVNCITNLINYEAEIAEMIRLFFPMAEVQFSDQTQTSEGELCVWFSECRFDISFSFLGEKSQLERIISLGGDSIESKRIFKSELKCIVFEAMQRVMSYSMPWGCLTGVTPTKLIRDMISVSNEKEIYNLMLNQFFVRKDKLDLAMEIIAFQMSILKAIPEKTYDLYVGVPFCRSRCVYCSFASYELGKAEAKESDVEAYVDALEKEIDANLTMMSSFGFAIRAIYIGGGTPTALTAKQLKKIMHSIRKHEKSTKVEFTVEAGRPDTIDLDKLIVMKDAGVNRISINPQTIHDKTLQAIGRAHNFSQVKEIYELARKNDFENINMDVIMGLPLENIQMVQETMQEIVKMDVDNITVHTLAIKRAATLKTQMGEFSLPEDEIVSGMVDVAHKIAREDGMTPYYLYRQKYMRGNLENVGFCKPGKESLYNIDMMEECQHVLALGSGGISKWILPDHIQRVANPKHVATYIAKVPQMNEMRKQAMVALVKQDS